MKIQSSIRNVTVGALALIATGLFGCEYHKYDEGIVYDQPAAPEADTGDLEKKIVELEKQLAAQNEASEPSGETIVPETPAEAPVADETPPAETPVADAAPVAEEVATEKIPTEETATSVSMVPVDVSPVTMVPVDTSVSIAKPAERFALNPAVLSQLTPTPAEPIQFDDDM